MCSLSSKQNTLRGTGKEGKNKEWIVTSLFQLNSVLLHRRFFMVLRVFRLRIHAASVDRFICPNNNTEIMCVDKIYGN